ncbi:HEPN domain-containing protein [Candidatus Woesearchaeota archaeon]|nr:HEPN domain-containing protein [Candidatus Woesearchaeota archaeon]
MKIIEYLKNTGLLDIEIDRERNNIFKRSYAYSLTSAHLSKAEHNLKFSQDTDYEYIDWKIVGLYYAVYHSALGLLAKKGFIIKSHNAAFLMLIKMYKISIEDARLIDSLSKEDAEFYLMLKEERTKANYSTNVIYTKEMFKDLQKQAIIFINKVKTILTN